MRNHTLARNLANAFIAAQLGTTVATQERNNKDGKIGEFWYIFAEEIQRAMIVQQNSQFHRMVRDIPAIPEVKR